jgi:hypothetical protein
MDYFLIFFAVCGNKEKIFSSHIFRGQKRLPDAAVFYPTDASQASGSRDAAEAWLSLDGMRTTPPQALTASNLGAAQKRL